MLVHHSKYKCARWLNTKVMPIALHFTKLARVMDVSEQNDGLGFLIYAITNIKITFFIIYFYKS